MDKELVRGIACTILGIASVIFASGGRNIQSDVAGIGMGEGLFSITMAPFAILGMSAVIAGPLYILQYAFRRLRKK
ncbi:MAG: hypothetical protein ACPGLY_25430 [Rubripirellula sp.]